MKYSSLLILNKVTRIEIYDYLISGKNDVVYLSNVLFKNNSTLHSYMAIVWLNVSHKCF